MDDNIYPSKLNTAKSYSLDKHDDTSKICSSAKSCGKSTMGMVTNSDSSANVPADHSISAKEIVTRISNVRHIINVLEEDLQLSRTLEADQWLKHAALRAQHALLINDLKRAKKRNKNMLNLFRQSVTDIRLGDVNMLPESLNREVQRIWHKKYDALLSQNERLRKEVDAREYIIKKQKKEIDSLQQRLLNLGESLAERNETVRNLCVKYLSLKKRKDQQEVILRAAAKTGCEKRITLRR